MRTRPEPLDYYALTDAEKRVAVAEDVIQRLNVDPALGGIEPSFVYFEISDNSEEIPAGDLRDNLQDFPPCQVCAIGALFYGQVMLGNGVTLSASRHRIRASELRQKLTQIFSVRQLDQIEAAYEGFWADQFPASGAFYRQSIRHCGVDRRGRMRRIMQNIVRNQGTFCPELEVW